MMSDKMFDELIPLTDSRSLSDAPRTLFFALRTATGDGHRFIPELYRRGVRHFVVEPTFNDKDYPGATFLKVDSPLRALQEMAAERRKAFNGKVIGVTGSRGKTMVKEWLGSLLSPSRRVCRSPRSYNSQIGVPLSVWRLSDRDDIGIFEAGISQTGEMQALADIIRPDIAVITSIGPEHAEGFASRCEKIAEKIKLATDAGTIIYPAYDSDLAEAIARTYPDRELVGWTSSSIDASPEIPLRTEINADSAGRLRIRYSFRGGDPREFAVAGKSPWEGENAVTSLAVMLVLGFGDDEIRSAMEALLPVGTRLEVTNGVNDSLVVQDDYTADLSSLAIALDFAQRRLAEGRRLSVILSDIVPDGDDLDTAYRRAGQLLRLHGVKRCIGIGPEISRRFGELGVEGRAFATVEEFLDKSTPTDFASEMILVKGAPRFGFDRVVNHLEAKTHETVLEVNLDAMVDNFNFFRSKLRAGTGIVAMVKASGYGAGSLELAKTLQAHGAAYLAVAVGDEGAELRQAGITMPIMVLNPTVLNYTQLFSNHLEPEIFSFESLAKVVYEARRAGITRFPVHIKLDTGMHRLGFREEQIPELLERLKEQDAVEVRSVFSHLATADCLDQDDYTLGQLRYFDRCSQQIADGLPYRILRHVLNTAGILRFPEHQYDMVRLGIGLYGIPILNNGMEEGLRPISTLRSVIIALHDWDKTETIGYGRRGVLTRDSVVATVPVGYADGFNRHCGRGNWHVMVNGHRCPVVGNICMDICMVDVTDVPGVRVGDPVTIFGRENTVMEMADVLDTIPYECLTSVSPRVRRVYYRES